MPEQGIYESAEDSYLMSSALASEIPKLLKENSDLKFLEVGVGNGINLKTVLNLGIKRENILGTDINNNSVKHCKKIGFNCIKSDLFEEFKGGVSVRGNLVPLKFDIIVFNPPYLPLDKKEPLDSRSTTTGGKRGNEIAIKFLKEAKKFLIKDGRILIITSSLSSNINFKLLGYKSKKIAFGKLFFEEISLWELKIKTHYF